MSSLVAQSRWARLGHEFSQRLNPAEQAAVLSWASFTAMFTGLRVLTHWIHRGHGPKGGGISVGGRHFHHYNIGIALLSAVDAEVGRTTDPVRMYMREMGTVELLTREGEIAIAKRIEAGREMMIGGLCESPLTMRAVIGWRDALMEGKMLLRDVVEHGAPQGDISAMDDVSGLQAVQHAVGAPADGRE